MGATPHAPRRPLPAELLGRYEASSVRLPGWVPVATTVVVLVAAVLAVALGQYLQASAMVLLGVAAVTSVVSRRRQPKAATVVTADGARVVLPYRAEQVTPWVRVHGVRTFTRRTPPQLLLADGSAVQLVGLPDDAARALARHLPALLGRAVAHEVDGRLLPLPVEE